VTVSVVLEVGVVVMGHRGVTAVITVLMCMVLMLRVLQRVLVVVVAMRTVGMTIVNVIDMVVVPDGGVTARLTMLMRMVLVRVVGVQGHGCSLLW